MEWGWAPPPVRKVSIETELFFYDGFPNTYSHDIQAKSWSIHQQAIVNSFNVKVQVSSVVHLQWVGSRKHLPLGLMEDRTFVLSFVNTMSRVRVEHYFRT